MIRITIWLFLLSATFYIVETKATAIKNSNQRRDVVKGEIELKDCKYGWTKSNDEESVCMKGKSLIVRLENLLNVTFLSKRGQIKEVWGV